MEGFETVGNIPATLRDLADQGYTSRQRGGAVYVRKGVHVTTVHVIRGSDLPPCVIARWMHGELLRRVGTGIRTFDTEEALNAWLHEWDIRVSRHPRRLA